MTESGEGLDDHVSGSSGDWRRAHDHAWNYFELHAGQRLTLFNFFTVLTGFATAGIAATLQGSARFSILGVALGGLLVLLSFVFWKLDQRAAFLVKHAEAIQELAEVELLPEGGRTIAGEPTAMAAARSARSPLRRIWTFGTSFRLLFIAAAMFGMVSAVLCGVRFAGVVDWSPPATAGPTKPSAAQASGQPAAGKFQPVPARLSLSARPSDAS